MPRCKITVCLYNSLSLEKLMECMQNSHKLEYVCSLTTMRRPFKNAWANNNNGSSSHEDPDDGNNNRSK